MAGIVRAADRDAIWREAAEKTPDEILQQHGAPTSTPPSGASPPQPPDDSATKVVVPNSNKFKTPANGLKKLLDGITQSSNVLAPGGEMNYGAHSHPVVKDWIDKHPDFAKTYFKPDYQEALKAHLGEDNYAKLTYHMPGEHHQALTTHAQKPAPNSNKFKTPANGLKKLLDNPDTTPDHVKAWVDSHPDFAKGYLHNPEYQNAIKGHLGEKAYTDWAEHLKPGQKSDGLPEQGGGKPKQPVEYKQVIPLKKPQAEPEYGSYHPKNDAEWEQLFGHLFPGQKVTKLTQQAWKGLPPSTWAKIESGEHPAGKSSGFTEWKKLKDQGSDADEISQIKQQMPADQQKAWEEHAETTQPMPPGWQPPTKTETDQHAALAAGIKKIFPNTTVPLDQLSTPELKKQLEDWQKYLPEHEGFAKHVPQLQALYDQHFGAGAQQAAPGKPLSDPSFELASDIYKINPHFSLEKLQKMSPESAKELVQSQAANWPGDTEKGKAWQALLDKHFGQGGQPSAPSPEQQPAPSVQDVQDQLKSDPWGSDAPGVKPKTPAPSFNEWLNTQGKEPGTMSDQEYEDYGKQYNQKFYPEPGQEQSDEPEPLQDWEQELLPQSPQQAPGGGGDQGTDWHDPQFQQYMKSVYGLDPSHIEDIAKHSAPGGKYEHAGSIGEYLHEFAKNKATVSPGEPWDAAQWAKEMAKHFHLTPENINSNGKRLKDMTPEEAQAVHNDWGQSVGIHDADKPGMQAIYDKYFGGAKAPAAPAEDKPLQNADVFSGGGVDKPAGPPPFDPKSFATEFKALFSGSSWINQGEKTPEEAEAKLKGLVDSADASYPNTEKTQQAHALYDKYFGAGVPAAAPAESPKAPVQPAVDPKTIVQEMAKVQGLTPEYAHSSMSPNKGKNWIEQTLPELEQELKYHASDSFSASPTIKAAYQAVYDKYFGGGAPAAPAGGQHPAQSPSFDSSAFLSDYQQLYPDTAYAQKVSTPEGAKAHLEMMLAKTNLPPAKHKKLQVLYDKYFGTGAQGSDADEINQIKQMQEPEEDEGVSPAFKDTPASPEDVANFSAHKPESAADWKNFSKWWGGTQLSPEQEQGIYSAWFPGKNPAKASDWFAKVYQFHAKPSAGDLGAQDTPAWAHADWAFGNKADAEWPVFKEWATKHPGVPKNTTLKQKLAIWSGLSAGDKKAIAEDYLPKNPIDTKAALGALQQAFPDSDFTKWADMGQGTLKDNVEMLAKAGYKKAIPVYNQFFGGNMEVPPEVPPEQGQQPEPQGPKSIPIANLPDWAKKQWGEKESTAANYTGLKHFADTIGMSEAAESGKIPGEPSYYHQPYKLVQMWNAIPDHLKDQIATMSSPPWHDEASFKAWLTAQPKPIDEIKQILPENALYSSTWNVHPTGSYKTNQGNFLGKMIEQQSDPQKKQALLGIYHNYYASGKPTLAQSLKEIYPVPPKGLKATDWDQFLKGNDTAKVASTIKKLLKTEQDPEKFIALVDTWAKYFPHPDNKYKVMPSGVAQITSVLGEHGSPGSPVGADSLKQLKWWKEHGGDPGTSAPNYWQIPDNYDPGPYIKGLAAKEDAGGYMGYHGWTPPGKATAFQADPAMLGSTGPNYAAPEQKKGTYFVKLLEQLDKHKASYSKADRDVAGSEEFQGWFEHASTPYKQVFQHNPGIALDDYKAFMAGSTADPQVPEGGGAAQSFDPSPFANVPKPGQPNTQKFPKSLTKNKPRPGGEKIELPQYGDDQETLPLPPGQQWAPRRAPMPIYRVIPNTVLDLDKAPDLPLGSGGMSPKQKEFFLQQQRARLRRIDEIINGTAQRNPANDYKAFEQWGIKNDIPAKAMTDLKDEIFSTQPTLSADEKWKHFEETAKNLGIPEQALYDLASKVGVGNPGQAVPGAKGNYEHPELAKLVLDYIEGAAGLGTHWTRDMDKLYEGIPTAGIDSAQMKGNGRRIPVLLSGLWSGQGETSSAEGGAYDPMSNSEREHNLHSGAPVYVHRVQIRSPDNDWHDLMDYGPQSLWPPGRNETATHKKVLDKPSLADRLDYDLGGKHDPKEWDTLVPGLQADAAFRKLFKDNGLLDANGAFKPNLDKNQGELKDKLLKVYRQFFVGRPDLPTKPHHRHASLQSHTASVDDLEEAIEVLAYTDDPAAFDPWDDTDPYEHGYDEDSDDDYDDGAEGQSLEDVDPRYFKRPSMPPPNSWMKYYSPHDVNPEAPNEGRPYVDWQEQAPEQDRLPLPTQNEHGYYDPAHAQWPMQRKPIPMYRGMMLDLNDPRLGEVSRALRGQGEDPEGQGDMFKGLKPTPNPAGYDNSALGSKILDFVQNSGYHQRSNDSTHAIGPHWSADPKAAISFAGMNRGLPDHLPVVLRAQWKGAGEDPYRGGTGGEFPEESEVTMLPGANMHVDSVQIRHPKTLKWHEALDKPSERQAAIYEMVPRKQGRGVLTHRERYGLES